MKRQILQIEKLPQYCTVSETGQNQKHLQNLTNIFKNDKFLVKLNIQKHSLGDKRLQIQGQILFQIKQDIPNDLSIDLTGLFTLQVCQNQVQDDSDLSNIQLQIRNTQQSFTQHQDPKVNLRQSKIQVKDRNRKGRSNSNRQIARQHFLDCSQQLYQLDQYGKPLKYLKYNQASKFIQNKFRRIDHQQAQDQRGQINQNCHKSSLNQYSYPFKFEVCGQFPPTLNPLRFDDLQLKVFYILRIKNSYLAHSWAIDVKKGSYQKDQPQQNSDPKKEEESSNTKIIVTPFKAKLDQASKRELKINYSCVDQILSNQTSFKLYKYCFCDIGQFTIEATVKVPKLNQFSQKIESFQLYLKVQLYGKDDNRTDQQILELISDIEIALIGQLKGFRKKVFVQKTLALTKQQEAPGGLYAQIVLKLNRKYVPASQKNQLFSLQYFLEVEPIFKSFRIKKTVENKRQIII